VSDKFERELREHLHLDAGKVNEFPRDLAGRIRNRIEPRRGFGLMQQLALAGALILLAGLLAYGIGQLRASRSQPAGQNQTVPTSSPQAIQPSTSPQLSTGVDLFSCVDETWGGSGPPAQLTAVRFAQHDGYDRLTLEFAAHLPSYGLVRQASPDFVKDASGQPVKLKGKAGLKVILKPATAAYPLPAKRPSLSEIQDFGFLGDFEQVVTLGIGLSQPACIRVFELSNPTRLVIDFDTSAPTPATRIELRPFSCSSRESNSTAAVTLDAVRVRHQTGFDRVVFEFAGSSVPGYSLTPQSNATFTRDPGGPVNLSGSAGLLVVLSNTAAYQASVASSPTPVVTKVEQLNEFKPLAFGVGLNRAACFRVTELTNPGRLVIDFETPPAAG
jgi:hypothetical protein